jgi:VanZ family protein
MNKILILGFHAVNLILIIFYLYPGSLLGLFLYNDSSIQAQITEDFLISSNHFYSFIILSIIGIITYNKSNKINLLIKYLFLLSVSLEFFHFIIPNRNFELSDLFGNILGVFFVIVIYKIKNKYV